MVISRHLPAFISFVTFGMQKTETLEEFYKRKVNRLPQFFTKQVGHFNVFRLSDFAGRAPYSRRDFYKISLVIGKNRFHYADKSIEVDKAALMFFNPNIPYSCEPLSDHQEGAFCIFTEEFILNKSREKLNLLPMFRPDSNPVYYLDKKQVKAFWEIYEKMFREIDSDYVYKFDLLSGYVLELIHSALKMQPAETLLQHHNAATRITSLFIELLERQFPIESPQYQFSLRSANDYAAQLAVHVNHLNRVLKDATGKTTTTHIAERITREAKALLKNSDWNIAEIGYSLGFEDPAHFNNFFKKQTTLTPRAFRDV